MGFFLSFFVFIMLFFKKQLSTMIVFHFLIDNDIIFEQILKLMLEDKDVKDNKILLASLSDDIKLKSNFSFILSDPTRVKILFLLKLNKELCVTDLSNILGISMGAVSHQLSLMEQSGCVYSVKMGQMVCYLLNKKNEIVKLFNFNFQLKD